MFSEPAVGEKFFGREEALEILSKRALALKDGYRQNIALTGQSLAGKTSIILNFLHTIKEEGFIPVYVEVVKEPFKAFANKFIATMLYNALLAHGEDAGIDLDGLMISAARYFPKTHAAMKEVLSLIELDERDQAYSRLLELTSVLKAESMHPCIVILDEFDNLEYLGIRNPFTGFGKVIMVQKDTMYIVSSSRNLAIRKIISEKLSLLFGNFEIVKVANFGIRVSNEFINIRLPGFEIEDLLRKFLIAFTDGNPFYLSRMLRSIRDAAINRMTSYIDSAIVADIILELVYNSNGAIHQYLMNYLLELLDARSRDMHISILTCIANGENKQSDIARKLRIRRCDISTALQRLSEQGLLSKNGIFYTIEDAMLEFWLKNVYQEKKNLLINGIFDRTTLYREKVLLLISDFEREFSLPAIERVADLFSLFSNELVQLDTKSAKLPHFTKTEIRSFADGCRYLIASFRGNHWIVQAYDHDINENDIISFVKNIKGLNCKISNKVIIPIRGIDENARLIAKELKISIWESRTINKLLTLYGKKRIIAI
ncbi:MAG: ATP-binding protein [Candidatus Omnitrophica bacterium]|nr:ATP-binding protein [Candidatus Omnitrophota bacterium]